MSKSKSITLSPKHGLNPSITHCECCGKELGIALFGRLKGDAEAPKQIEGELCDECKKKYITIVEVESETNRKGTGRCAYIPKEAVNIECKDGIALMATEEFTKMFIK